MIKKNLKLPDDDNNKLSNLCGPFDENLKQISTGLEIEISRRGSSFILNGNKSNTELGYNLIKDF